VTTCYTNRVVADKINKPSQYLWSFRDLCNDVLVRCFGDIMEDFKCSKCGSTSYKIKIQNNYEWKYCPPCKMAVDRSYRLRNKDRLRDLANKRKKANSKEFYRKKTEYHKDYCRRPENIGKVSARWAVGNAIKAGKLTKEPCQVCGELKVEAHHDSYLPKDKLNVMWLCKEHHKLRHEDLKDV